MLSDWTTADPTSEDCHPLWKTPVGGELSVWGWGSDYQQSNWMIHSLTYVWIDRYQQGLHPSALFTRRSGLALRGLLSCRSHLCWDPSAAEREEEDKRERFSMLVYNLVWIKCSNAYPPLAILKKQHGGFSASNQMLDPIGACDILQ